MCRAPQPAALSDGCSEPQAHGSAAGSVPSEELPGCHEADSLGQAGWAHFLGFVILWKSPCNVRCSKTLTTHQESGVNTDVTCLPSQGLRVLFQLGCYHLSRSACKLKQLGSKWLTWFYVNIKRAKGAEKSGSMVSWNACCQSCTLQHWEKCRRKRKRKNNWKDLHFLTSLIMQKPFGKLPHFLLLSRPPCSIPSPLLSQQPSTHQPRPAGLAPRCPLALPPRRP